jgi:hypothetical protein
MTVPQYHSTTTTDLPIAMAETSDHSQAIAEDPLPERPESSVAETNTHEATELARIRRRYSHASSFHQPGFSTASPKPTKALARFKYAVSKFWRHQVSITVDHDTCRDHLGMYSYLLYFCPANQLQIKSALCFLPNSDIGNSSPNSHLKHYII